MKKLILSLFIFSAFSISAQNAHTKEIKNHQYEQNLDFHNKEKSPLTKEDLKTFTALDFYEIDKKYKVLAKLVKEENPVVFGMPTTTDRKPLYIKYGTLTFTIDGKEQQLPVYQNKDFNRDPQYKDNLFIPFTDKTSGTTSYGGGRFLDVLTTDEKPNGTIEVDFNKAYNPYCAYSGRYSCPITPKENHITVEIRAGVKAYDKH